MSLATSKKIEKIEGKGLDKDGLGGIVEGSGARRFPARPGGPRGQKSAAQAGMVGAILPETDRGGAEVTVRRLTEAMSGMGGLTVRFAVFPDDGTRAEELLSVAAA